MAGDAGGDVSATGGQGDAEKRQQSTVLEATRTRGSAGRARASNRPCAPKSRHRFPRLSGRFGRRVHRSSVRCNPCARGTVEQTGNNLFPTIARPRAAHRELAAAVVRGPHDGPGSDFGLEDRRHRLGAPRQPRAHPVELRRVHRRHVHHRDPHVTAVVEQLAAQRFGEPESPTWRAIGGLQAESPAAPAPSRPERSIRDRAAASGAAPPSSKYVPEIVHLRHAPVFVVLHLYTGEKTLVMAQLTHTSMGPSRARRPRRPPRLHPRGRRR